MHSCPPVRSSFPQRTGRRVAHVPACAVCGILFTSLLLALPQALSQLPATQPTAAAYTTTPKPATQRAVVLYSGGMLSIRASNSSLNQILREISRQTGMKITGGVAEDRVFGNYGPAAPAQVLGSLLDGTSSNVLLVQGNGAAPAELVLTPRSGSATPPNPLALQEEQQADAPPQTSNSNRLPLNTPQRTPEPAQSASQTLSVDPQPAQEPQNGAPSPVPDASSDPRPAPTPNPQSPNGVKTPQEIYQQLQQLHQQQQTTPPQE